MNRIDLKYAYSVMNLDERKALAKHMEYTIDRLYQYCLRPSSDSIGKDRLEKLLKFKPESYWRKKAAEGKQKAQKPIQLSLNCIELTRLPDVIIINGMEYVPKV